ncbi:phage tail protein [Oceanisphaera sp. KMM 10153]|uniref:phage tail protein n=1 Tax=Oceanisphaera submarina TaxID=3390193 RepID=UPI003976C5A7
MTALTFTITNAGRAEIINAENTGTGPVTITHIALGDALYTPAKTQTTLQHEIKRLDAFGGSVVADDVIHVTITDDSAEQYILGEFGLISDKGTLVGVYAQTTPILEKNPEGIMLLSADMTLTSIDATSITFGPAEFVYPPASLSRAGVVILSNATNSSRQDQASTPKAVKTVNDALTAHKDAINAHTKEQVGLDKLENWSWSHSYTDATGGAGKYASGKAVADAYNALNSAKLDKTGTATNSAKLDNQLPSFYLDWSNFTGVPTQAKRWPSFAEVTDKPATYPPDNHAHSWNSITGKPVGIDEPGLVAAFAMATPPEGWLKANGAAVSRTAYAALFAAIGTTFGTGDGSTTFNLPDMRGEFPRGWDDGRGVDVGREFGSQQGDAIRNITGTFNGGYRNAGSVGAFEFIGDQVYHQDIGWAGGGWTNFGSGGDKYDAYKLDASRQVPTADENRPRNIALLYCIKY